MYRAIKNKTARVMYVVMGLPFVPPPLPLSASRLRGKGSIKEEEKMSYRAGTPGLANCRRGFDITA
jgi:hypothetical protein